MSSMFLLKLLHIIGFERFRVKLQTRLDGTLDILRSVQGVNVLFYFMVN